MWPSLSRLSDFSGLLLLIYFLWRAVLYLRALYQSQHRRDSAELDSHRRAVTDRAKKGEDRLEAELARVREELAQARAEGARAAAEAAARYEALQERRLADVREMLAAGNLGEAAAVAERALEAVYTFQRTASLRDAALADAVARRVIQLQPAGTATMPPDPPRLLPGPRGNDPP